MNFTIDVDVPGVFSEFGKKFVDLCIDAGKTVDA